MNRLLIAATTVAMSLCVLDATAAPEERVVRYSDLDPNSNRDTAALYQRLRMAARGVCGPSFSQRAASDRILFENCVDKSIIAAAQEIDRDLLIEYVDGRIR
jgi:UrcA family protein